MIHYHGTPITPKEQLLRMAGRNFCVSFARSDNLKTCLSIGQSVMFDNGAFTAFMQGKQFDKEAYYRWLDPILVHPHWAVIPDVIDGSLAEQQECLASWPRELFGYECAAPVFHLHMPLHHLNALVLGYPKVCLGSSGEYWKVGNEKWSARMDEIFNYLARTNRRMPYIHGLRMLSQSNGGWPLASADSTNVGQNFKRFGCAECLAQRLDGQQPVSKWKARLEQMDLYGGDQ